MASTRYVPAILVGRAVRFIARLRKRDGGSAIPGLVVNRIAPGFLPHALNSFPDGLVIVSGSSGKSTTTKMIVAILRAHGRTVFTNPSTANISQGLTSALLEKASVTGRLSDRMAVLEMDEGHGALVARDLDPHTVILTNVMTDQIDRFFESEQVAELLERIAERATGTVVYNADDALLAELAARLKVAAVGFGAAPDVLAAAPRGLGYARQVQSRPRATVEVTAVHGRAATLDWDGVSMAVELPARASTMRWMPPPPSAERARCSDRTSTPRSLSMRSRPSNRSSPGARSPGSGGCPSSSFSCRTPPASN